MVSILRLINTFWLSFYQTQNIVHEINDSVFYQGVLKILVILRPYTTETALPELLKARDMYEERHQDALSKAQKPLTIG